VVRRFLPSRWRQRPGQDLGADDLWRSRLLERRAEYERADGTTGWAVTTSSAVRDEHGEFLHAIRVVADITEQKHAEQELREREQQYEAVVENMADGVSVFSQNERLFVNQAFADMRGYSSREAALTAPVGDMIEANDRAAWVAHSDFSQPVRTKRSTILRQDGSTRIVDVVFNAITYRGQPAWSAVLRDVTDAEVARRELEASVQRFHSLFEHAPMGISLFNSSRAILDANPALAAMLGYSTDELTGRFLRDLSAVDPASPRKDRLGQVIRGQVDSFKNERLFQRKNGDTGWTMVTSWAVRDGNGGFLHGIQMVEDITERKHAEEELLQSEERFRRLFESAPIGMAVVERDRTVRESNPALQRMLGRSAQELFGKDLIPSYADPSERGSAQHHFERLVHGEIDTFRNQREMLASDGTTLSTDHTVAPVRDANGEFMFAIRMVQDVTEREQMDRMKDEFLGIVSHELRTPLTSIRVAVGLLAANVLGEMPEQALSTLAIARSNTERLVRLVNDILDLERFEAGKTRLDLGNLGARVVVEQAIETVQPTAVQAEVLIQADVPSIALEADAKLVGQTLTNLLSNAVKFAPAGSVVRISAQRDGTMVRFQVSGEGRGVPESDVEKIFDKFQQVDSSDSRTHGCSGLGLAIARHVVGHHRGRIWVEPNPGGGAVFKLELPTTHTPEQEREKAPVRP
jgi:PAS domain S-box-containing protein